MILLTYATASVHVCYGLVTVPQCKVAYTGNRRNLCMLQHGHVSMILKGDNKSAQPV